ncbi:unnamed protein product [Vicia faba]|uniref:Uncharacterized protein n=1 Tax=Vicia faba TaxID=3906 RepID=A0AAV1AAK2_VICFA|nr:unnamed protein product [Vicia faba]
MMSRRPGNSSRRFGDGKSKSSPLLSIALIVVGALFIIGYFYKGSGGLGGRLDSVSRVEGDYLCSGEVQRAIPVLQKAYGDSMHKVLHVGPDTCYVVSRLQKEDETEAWGIEPYDVEETDNTLDYLSPKYLNKTLPDLARVSSDGLVIFTGIPTNQKAKVADVSKFGRAAKMRSGSWWVKFFLQNNLEENEAGNKKFEQASTKSSYVPKCQIFHLKSLH